MDPMERLVEELKGIMQELFENCEESDGVYRSFAEHLGVVDTNAIVEAVVETGIRPEVPYPAVYIHTTLAQKIEPDVIPALLISLNALNHVIASGSFPSFGSFIFYPPLNQIYLSYRMPINIENLDADLDNLRYYLGVLYEQLDLFMDFILFTCNSPTPITITEYMEYLDTVSDLDDISERSAALKKAIENFAALEEDSDGEA